MWLEISIIKVILHHKLTDMMKFLSLVTLFLLFAGGICAVGIKSTAPLPCKQPAKTTKTVAAKSLAKDDFKAKYWVLSSIFRF
jgi:hypothetical protein